MGITFTDLLPVLKKITIFAGLAESGIARIVSECETISYADGDVIVKEGAPASSIFIMLSGKVKIVLDLDNEPLEICTFGPGSCLGEASVIGITNHSASAVVEEEATLLVLSRKLLMHLFEVDKEFFSLLILNIARELARRLHHTDEILLQYARQKLLS